MSKPVYYMQTDAKWKNTPYAVSGESATIGSAGCGPTSAAMVIATLKDAKVTPVQTAAWSLAKGYKFLNQGTGYGYFVPQLKEYGIGCTRLNTTNLYHMPSNSVHDTALAQLKAGNWLICCMGPGTWTKGGHYVLAYAYDNGKVSVNDPASTDANRAVNSWDVFKNEVKYYFAIAAAGAVKQDDLYWAYASKNTQIYSDAGLSKILGSVTAGTGLTCNRTKSTTNAVRCNHASLGDGYIRASEVSTTQPKAVVADPLYWGNITGTSVNLRSTPSTSGKILAVINAPGEDLGRGVTCDASKSTADWIRVHYAPKNVDGYVFAKYVQKA